MAEGRAGGVRVGGSRNPRRGAGAAEAGWRPPAGVWWRSFVFAGAGLRRAWRAERNLRIQASAAWAALLFAWFCRLPAGHVAVLLSVMAAVLSAETMNSAVEVVVDLAAPGPHALAAAAKDLAAGAVLAMSAGALAVGVAVFWPLPAHLRRLLAAASGHPVQAAAGLAVLLVLAAAAGAPLPGRRQA